MWFIVFCLCILNIYGRLVRCDVSTDRYLRWTIHLDYISKKATWQAMTSLHTFLSLQCFFKQLLISSIYFRLAQVTMIIRMYFRLLISDLDLHSAEVHIVSIQSLKKTAILRDAIFAQIWPFRAKSQFFANFALARNFCANLGPCGAQIFRKSL